MNAELRSALADDISGIRPDFVVPVLIEQTDVMPRFLTGKKYIDVHGQSELEWLTEFEAVALGRHASAPVAEPNLQAVCTQIGPTTYRVEIRARFWPAPNFLRDPHRISSHRLGVGPVEHRCRHGPHGRTCRRW